MFLNIAPFDNTEFVAAGEGHAWVLLALPSPLKVIFVFAIH